MSILNGISPNTYGGILDRYSEFIDDSSISSISNPFTINSIYWGTNPTIILVNKKTDIRVIMTNNYIHITIPSLYRELRFTLGDRWTDFMECTWHEMDKDESGCYTINDSPITTHRLDDTIDMDIVLELFKPWILANG